MKQVVIAGYARSPFTLAKKGELATVRPDRLAAQTQHFVGDRAHDADVRAAIDQTDAARRHCLRQRACGVGVIVDPSAARTAVDAEAFQFLHRVFITKEQIGGASL